MCRAQSSALNLSSISTYLTFTFPSTTKNYSNNKESPVYSAVIPRCPSDVKHKQASKVLLSDTIKHLCVHILFFGCINPFSKTVSVIRLKCET